MENKIFTCECGKQFTNIQAFRGHKSHCKSHHLAKYGNLEVLEETKRKERISLAQTNEIKHKELEKQKQLKQEQELQQWISEQHKCERCGRIMTEKFRSGRFCSSSCANKRKHSEETKEKIRNSLLYGSTPKKNPVYKKKYIKRLAQLLQYRINPKLCAYCGKPIPFNKRNNKTCSNDCAHKSCGVTQKGKPQPWNHKGTKKVFYYKGFAFGSSYELAVVQSLDENNISWEKPKYFKYIIDGNEHTYTPDIYLPEYNVYLDPKNDFLINNINPHLGYRDVEKIKSVEEQNHIKVIILDKDHLTWESIKKLLDFN